LLTLGAQPAAKYPNKTPSIATPIDGVLLLPIAPQTHQLDSN
jgi:hypothetical protein